MLAWTSPPANVRFSTLPRKSPGAGTGQYADGMGDESPAGATDGETGERRDLTLAVPPGGGMGGTEMDFHPGRLPRGVSGRTQFLPGPQVCLLYTSDAADD